MKSLAKLLEMTAAELERMPPGAKVSYVGTATFFMEKQPDGMWKLVRMDPGLKLVSSAYVAGKYPESDENG